MRDRVVPGPDAELPPDPRGPAPDATATAIDRLALDQQPGANVPHAPARQAPRKNYSWAELLRRVFLIDVLTCPHCQGPRRLLAAIFDPEATQAILRCLGLPTEPPAIAPARSPPQSRLPW